MPGFIAPPKQMAAAATSAVAQRDPGGNDVIAKAAAVGNYVGDWLLSAFSPVAPAHPNAQGQFQGSFGGNAAQVGAQTTVWASDKDPTKWLTGPVLANLHAMGIGAQGDQWDKGIFGIAATGFQKIGSLATYVALDTTTSANGNGWDAAAFDPKLNQRAWDIAFDPSQRMDFGAAMLSDKSVLTNPNGVMAQHAAMNNTVGANFVAGVLTAMSYAALDPTKGLSRVMAATRAAHYISGSVEADKLDKIINDANNTFVVDSSGSATHDATVMLPPVTAAQRALDIAKGTFGVKQDLYHTASYQLQQMNRTYGITDFHEMSNILAPQLAMGSTASKIAMPGLIELFTDAGKVADQQLQAQLKYNIFNALAGGDSAKQWLATNYPMIAAKGARMTSAPREFTLLDNMMTGYQAAADGGDMSTFDFNSYLNDHYETPAQQAELAAAKPLVEQVQNSKALIDQSLRDQLETYAKSKGQIAAFGNTLATGGEQGMKLNVATSGEGVLAVPRAMESIKSALAQHVLETHVLQLGNTGKTLRIVANFGDYLSSPKANGFINIESPLVGSKQLMGTLSEFRSKLDDPTRISSDYISQAGEALAKAPQSQREGLVKNINDHLLQLIADEHTDQVVALRGTPLTVENVQGMIRQNSQAFTAGRAFAERGTAQAEANGDSNTFLGDTGGGHTVIPMAQIRNHLNSTTPIVDWKHASDTVNSWYSEKRLIAGLHAGEQKSMNGLTAYNRAWKYAQLMRPGLATRVLLDTGTRSAVAIGVGTYALQALNGVANLARRKGIVGLGLHNGEDGISAAAAMDHLDAIQSINTAQKLAARNTDLNAVADRIDQTEASVKVMETAADLRDAAAENYPHHHNLGAYLNAQAEEMRMQAAQLRAGLVDDNGLPLDKTAIQAELATNEKAIAGLHAAQENFSESPAPYFSNGTNQRKYPTPLGTYGFRVSQGRAGYEADTAALGARGTGNVFLDGSSNDALRYRADANHGTDHMQADNPLWSRTVAATANDLQKSPSAMYLAKMGPALSKETPAAIIKQVLGNPVLKQEYTALRGPGTTQELAAWATTLSNSIKSFTQSPVIEKMLLSGKPLEAKEIDRQLPQVADRFPIFGPDFSLDASKHRMDNFFHAVLDVPDQTFARHPMLNGLYDQNVRQLLPQFAERAQAQGRTKLTEAELATIHSEAKGAAINDVRRDMYDVSDGIGTHGVMSLMAPFFAPWKNVLESWGRMIYDDPATLGLLLRMGQTADMFGLTTDQNGNTTTPFDGTAMKDKYVNIPMIGLGGITHWQLNMGSINTVHQGNIPMAPGFGTTVQVPVQWLVTQQLPKFGLTRPIWSWLANNKDSIINQSLFTSGDIPRGDAQTILGGILPSYARKLTDFAFGDSPLSLGNIYPDAFATRLNDLIIQYRTANGGADPSHEMINQMQTEASATGRAAALLTTVMSWGFGMSGTAKVEGQFYVDKMHALNAAAPMLKAQGLTPTTAFAMFYPDAARLNWTFSVNEGRIEATVNATSAYYKYNDLMASHPAAAWFIAGPDNVLATLPPGDPGNGNPAAYSQSAYNQQMTMGLRKRYSATDLANQTDIAMGQGLMDQFNRRLAVYMQQTGVKSLNSSAGDGLRALKAQTTLAIRAAHPQWAVSQDQMDTGLRSREIQQIADIALNPRTSGYALYNRPDVAITRQYLMQRQQTVNAAAAAGVIGWQTSNAGAPFRAPLYQYGLSLAAKNIVFAAGWSHIWESEFKTDLAKTAGSSHP